MLLVAATAVTIAMGDYIEAGAILVVIVINAAIGFFTEWTAANALSALQKQSVRVAHVVREGKESEIPAAELVQGDLVILRRMDIMAIDAAMPLNSRMTAPRWVY